MYCIYVRSLRTRPYIDPQESNIETDIPDKDYRVKLNSLQCMTAGLYTCIYCFLQHLNRLCTLIGNTVILEQQTI